MVLVAYLAADNPLPACLLPYHLENANTHSRFRAPEKVGFLQWEAVRCLQASTGVSDHCSERKKSRAEKYYSSSNFTVKHSHKDQVTIEKLDHVATNA
jgi:hypothetical protein